MFFNQKRGTDLNMRAKGVSLVGCLVQHADMIEASVTHKYVVEGISREY
jgi:hypothetical protein